MELVQQTTYECEMSSSNTTRRFRRDGAAAAQLSRTRVTLGRQPYIRTTDGASVTRHENTRRALAAMNLHSEHVAVLSSRSSWRSNVRVFVGVEL